ncbi:hypothetical protein PDL71_15580 [Lacibacter sp. MH-610]|uniref:hypothetical protein n=1 Tax=Lacibacter sp. MH-610 TaxID=3020883 RepID=UPI0038916288
MTNGDDLVTPYAWKQGADGKTPVINDNTNALTKREYFAAITPITIDDIPLPIAKLIMGNKPPDETMENVLWWADAEARYKVIKADALIKALNEQP